VRSTSIPNIMTEGADVACGPVECRRRSRGAGGAGGLLLVGLLVGRAGLEPATNGLTPRRSRWLQINPVTVCAPSDYVAHQPFMVAVDSRCLSTINETNKDELGRAGLSLAAALAITADSKSQPAIGRAGRWPAPDRTCPRCERPVPA
jgi:hypothetical protein